MFVLVISKQRSDFEQASELPVQNCRKSEYNLIVIEELITVVSINTNYCVKFSSLTTTVR